MPKEILEHKDDTDTELRLKFRTQNSRSVKKWGFLLPLARRRHYAKDILIFN